MGHVTTKSVVQSYDNECPEHLMAREMMNMEITYKHKAGN